VPSGWGGFSILNRLPFLTELTLNLMTLTPPFERPSKRGELLSSFLKRDFILLLFSIK
jgi:hypothetical protein